MLNLVNPELAFRTAMVLNDGVASRTARAMMT
jgi:hypothetical protein